MLDGERVDRLPCDDGGLWHVHGRACLHRLGSRLPVAPVGWRWAWGRRGGAWGLWLVDVSTGALWHPVGFAPMRSAGDLAHLMHAVTVGALGVRLE
jgi:hypothetical protein